MFIEYQAGENGARLFVDGVLVDDGYEIPPETFLDLLVQAGADVSQPVGEFCADCGEFVNFVGVATRHPFFCAECESRWNNPEDSQ
jgi:hypothetical protein